jgi:hypothetical protein
MFKRQKLHETKAEDSYIKNFTSTECLNGKNFVKLNTNGKKLLQLLFVVNDLSSSFNES